MHGEFSKAFQASGGGVLLAFLAVVAAPWLMISAIRGRWLGYKPNGKAMAYISTVVIAILFVQWGFRLLGNFLHI